MDDCQETIPVSNVSCRFRETANDETLNCKSILDLAHPPGAKTPGCKVEARSVFVRAVRPEHDERSKMNLEEGAFQLGVPLDAAQLASFDQYLALLLDWNQRMSLTTITDPVEVVTKHFLDSLSCLLALPRIDQQPVQDWLARPLRAVDVGAGPGFPGLPLKIAWPALRLTLVESTGKKCRFLEQVIADLGLQYVTVINERAEDYGQGRQRASFDLALARALSRLPTALEYCLPLLKTGGWLIAQKGKDPQEEAAEARVALNTLGGSLHDILPVDVPGLDAQRSLVIVHKDAKTPVAYPRRAGIPQHQPLL